MGARTSISLANMSHNNVAGPQLFNALFGETLVDQPLIATGCAYALVIDRDPRVLLSPVLEGKQSVIGQRGRLGRISGKNAKDTTLFPNVVFPGNDLFMLLRVP